MRVIEPHDGESAAAAVATSVNVHPRVDEEASGTIVQIRRSMRLYDMAGRSNEQPAALGRARVLGVRLQLDEHLMTNRPATTRFKQTCRPDPE
jgi:hypothetical protein